MAEPSEREYLLSRHPLLGCLQKLNRAETHLQAVKQAIEDFANSDFYEVATELDYKGRLVGRAKNVKHPPPELSILIGDCNHNFRSALDHLAYQLASGYTDPLPVAYATTSAFPIYETGPRFRGKVRGVPGAARKMRGMSRSARASIERLQAYHRRKNPSLRALWMLEELSNIDKHRLLHLTGAVPLGASFGVESVGGGQWVLRRIKGFARPIKERALLVRLHGEFPSPSKMQVKAEVLPHVVFDKRTEARSVRGHPSLDVLAAIREAVGLTVFVELEHELRRLFPEYAISITIGD